MPDHRTDALADRLLSLVPQDGRSIGNGALRKELGQQLGREVSEEDYSAARDALVSAGALQRGRGRGGSLRRPAARPPEPVSRPEAGRAQAERADGREVVSYEHKDTRKNNPPVGLVSPDTDAVEAKTRWAYDPHLAPELRFDVGRSEVERLIDDALAGGEPETEEEREEQRARARAALLELKRRTDPYLVWTGKAERTSFEVDLVSLHVHERIDPRTILRAVQRELQAKPKPESERQLDLFQPAFEQLPYHEALEFYRHERGWANRLIAGDSLLVMNSLLKKEGLAGQVQMIYIDPPYGIKYGSNFQPFVDQRNVKDRKDQDLTQEPEMVKAFRDTWELGIHSYLTHLRDRLLLARDLLTESGSVFVQISDENVHRCRDLLDEVFGAQGFVGHIAFKKTTGAGSPSGGTETLPSVFDHLLWYSRSQGTPKYRQLYRDKELGAAGSGQYVFRQADDGRRVRLGSRATARASRNWRAFRGDQLTSQSSGGPQFFGFVFRGSFHSPKTSGWKTTDEGMRRLVNSSRLIVQGKTPSYVRFLDDFPAFPYNNLWEDTVISGFGDRKTYVVQTATRVIERCLLMTTDAGDLVLDPTCGAGTTAVAAEKWGRRWITCDTSRVAVTLAKQRLMTASYDYYELKYPHEGLKGGFIYKTVPHVTLKSIANNPEIDEIHAADHPAIETALAGLNRALRTEPPAPFRVSEGGRKGKTVDFRLPESKTVELPSGEKAPAGALLEWEVPFDLPEGWPAAARTPFERFHAARRTMQARMDASIAAHADTEQLFDQPQVDKKKLRITGPFTVEAVPFATVLALEEAQQPSEPSTAIARSGESRRQHSWRDELLKAGIRGKGGQRIAFADLEPLVREPGGGMRYLHCTGTVADTGERVVVSFGPEHASLEQRQVELALSDAARLVPKPRFVVFCAFEFDPEAAKDIDEKVWPGVTLLKVKMNADLLTEDLKKGRASNESFWLMGQPEVELRGLDDGRYQVEVLGFDYFDTKKGELVSGGTSKIAMWMLDTDYDERSLLPRQVFFPLAGPKDGWNRLKRTIRAELDEELLEGFHGTVSLPFEAGEYRKVAVKIVDDRGIESLRILHLD